MRRGVADADLHGQNREGIMSMSYERKMLEELAMPTREQAEGALLRALFRHGGSIKEIGSGQDFVDELADGY